MNKEDFILLAEKVNDGSANEEELRQFNRYYNAYQREYPSWSALRKDEQEDIGQLLRQRIQAQIHKSRAQAKQPVLWGRYVTAAAVLLLLSFGIYYYSNVPKANTTVTQNQDLEPGSNKAFLTLADGRKINLTQQGPRSIAEQSGLRIIKTAEGELVYQMEREAKAVGFNRIETPIGGQYHVQLPDGTGVWLNSSSSMRYPVRFTGDRRVVEITGEAYFEVAHNAHMPFIVKSDQQEIEVLGTHFNVMAYAEEPVVRTTLINGSVKIRASKNTLVLKPGEQAKVQLASAMLEPNADIESAVAWRSGKIQFTDMDIQSIMRLLARWYDFEVAYRGKQTTSTFGGSFSRSKKLSVILKSLESTGDVQFKIEGRRVIVMP